jgi:hypothetical protein
MEGKLKGGRKSYFLKKPLPCANTKRTAKVHVCRARQRYMFAMRLAQTHDKLCVFAVRFLLAHNKG